MNRADVDVTTLLKIVLILVIAWLALEVVQAVFHFAFWFLRVLPTIIGLAVVILIVLWLYDRL